MQCKVKKKNHHLQIKFEINTLKLYKHKKLDYTNDQH